MEFTIQERVILDAVFPKVQGQIETVRDAAWFKKDIALSLQEKLEANFRVENDSQVWDKELSKEIEVTDSVKDIIIAVLQMMDTKKMITEECLSLWDKFISDAILNR